MHLILPGSLENDPLKCSRELERGNILFFPQIPFEFRKEDQDNLLAAVQTGSELHKNIAYRPKQDRVSGLGDGDPETAEKVRTSLRNFSREAVAFAAGLLPHYAAAWRLDYASFRGIEEEGRNLAWKKRNDLIHTDAFPTRPTNGDMILRFFANLHPTRGRVWVTSDPFEKAAELYARDAGVEKIGAAFGAPSRMLKRVARTMGIPVVDRSPYDEFMLAFHDYLKKSEQYQKDCPKYRFEFPAGSAWMVFTDVAPHSVLSGQHAAEQTFLISKDSLADRELAPVRILERISRRQMTN